MIAQVNKATELHIIVSEKHSINLVLRRTNEANEPVNWTGDFKMRIENADQSRTMELTVGNGLAVAGHELTISRTIVQNTLPAGEYVYDLRNDQGDTSTKILKGKLTVERSVTAPIV